MASINYSSTNTGPATAFRTFIDKLNGPWHKRALQVFMVIVLAHWVEHLVQAHQVFILGMARPKSLGALGAIFPWLVSSEGLHYGYAIIMLAGLILLRPGFVGRARVRWNIALGIQVWHHFEHLLLLIQVLVGVNLFGSKVPTSILQLAFPTMRLEIHLIYNALVFIPMVLAVWYHLRPPASDKEQATCSCVHARASAAT